MFGRIAAILAKDLKVGRRESIITYLVIGPFLLAMLMRLMVPLMEGVPLTFAVTPDLSPALLASLRDKGEVVVLPDRAAVVRRVEVIDDVPGFVLKDGATEIVFEGNEAGYVVQLAQLVADATDLAAAPGAPRVTVASLGDDRPPTRSMAASLLAFSVLLVAGLAVGFSILDEKESGTLRVYVVTPLRFAEYLTAKLLAGALLGVTLAMTSTLLVTGLDVPFGPLVVALAAAIPVGLVLGLVVGTFAANQLGAIAMLKGLLFFFTSVPVAGFVLKGRLAWVLAPLPNHWAVQAIFAALTGGPLLVRAALAFGLGLVVLVGTVAVMHRRLGFAEPDAAVLGREARRPAEE